MLTDQQRMSAADLVAVPFELAAQGCGGKPAHDGTTYGLCHTCNRFGRAGDQLEPALKLVLSVAQCVNWERTDPLGVGFGAHGGDPVNVTFAQNPT